MSDDNHDKNIFGGANPNGVYVPLTEIEREVMDRLVQSQDIEVEIKGWGVIHNPWIRFGDHRVGVEWELVFNKPETPIPVYYFDLELRVASTKMVLLRKRYPTTLDGKPKLIGAGQGGTLFKWDIAIDHMSPALVKAIVPGAIGLTSRRIDRDTGDRTVRGNMAMSDSQKWAASLLDSQAKEIRDVDASRANKATVIESIHGKKDIDR